VNHEETSRATCSCHCGRTPEENFVKMSSQRFDGRPRFQFSATCKILSRGHPIHQRIVRACHLQHSMSVLVSATGCHPRPRHTAEIFKNQACTCLTKTRHRWFHWSKMEWHGCFLVARRLDVEVYGNAHQVFEGQICTICDDQLQNGPPKSPQSKKI